MLTGISMIKAEIEGETCKTIGDPLVHLETTTTTEMTETGTTTIITGQMAVDLEMTTTTIADLLVIKGLAVETDLELTTTSETTAMMTAIVTITEQAVETIIIAETAETQTGGRS
jgi:hypothetical protein